MAGVLAVALSVLRPAGHQETPGSEGRHQAQQGGQLALSCLSRADLLSLSNFTPGRDCQGLALIGRELYHL